MTDQAEQDLDAKIDKLISDYAPLTAKIPGMKRDFVYSIKQLIAEVRGDSTDKAIGVLNKFAEGKAHTLYVPKHAGHEIDDQFCVTCDEEIEPSDKLHTATELAQAVEEAKARRSHLKKNDDVTFCGWGTQSGVELVEIPEDATCKTCIRLATPPHNPTQQNTNTSNNALGGLPPRDWRHKGTGESAQSQEGE